MESVQGQPHRPAAFGYRAVDRQAQLVRVVGVGDVAVRLPVHSDAVDQVVDLGVERVMVHVARRGAWWSLCSSGPWCSWESRL